MLCFLCRLFHSIQEGTATSPSLAAVSPLTHCDWDGGSGVAGCNDGVGDCCVAPVNGARATTATAVS
jgi:hypothetical protein